MDVKLLLPLISTINYLQQENDHLREKLTVNSENSSIPPSKSFKKKKKIAKQKSSLKIGAQKGHPGSHRKYASEQEIDQIIKTSPPNNCKICNNILINCAGYQKYQVYDLENNKIKITEYRLEKIKCRKCRKIYSANLPEGISKSIFGANLCATITSLVVKYRLSKNKVVEILQDLYDFKLCVGSVSNIENRVNDALEKAYDNCAKKLKTERVVHADETRHIEKGKTQWAWLGASNSVTVFLLENSRSRKTAKKLLGENFDGILISDRYAAYNFKEPDERQICWAHLKRDFTKIYQRSGLPGKIGKELLFYQARVFYYWNLYKSKKISFTKLTKAIFQIKNHVEKVIYSGAHISDTRTANTCKNFLKVFDGFWNFSKIEGVEPTNNHAEQQIRSYVIYRKLSFGTKSRRGTLFLQRAFTISATCKKQTINFITYIAGNIRALNANHDPPLLFT